MKRIKLAAILAVATFGIGGAVIASNNAQVANVQNEGTLSNPDWQPLSPGHKGCDEQTSRPCIGYQDPTTMEVEPIAFGNEKP